jgi:hypothetical protein
MARLIDADALYNGAMKDEYFRFKEKDKTGREAFAYSCAMERLVEAPTVGGWVSVKDRKPDNGQDVLAYIDDYEESRITACNYDNGVWYDCVMNCKIVIPNITHWMPLPEPPKEDD